VIDAPAGRPFREARVDLTAIAHNVRAIRAVVGDSAVMAVVKAGGYGHGAEPVARAAVDGGAAWLGVVDIDEAHELRAAGVTAPILAWLHDPGRGFDDAIAEGIDLGLGSIEQLERAAAASGTANVQLKVDTGLSRGGAERGDWAGLFRAAAEHERFGRLRVRGLWSHLANAGDAEDAAQVALFEQAIELAADAGLTPELTHLAATAGALRVPSSRFGMVRAGIGLYGLSPFEDATSAALGLRPALELSAAITSIKRVPAGTGVSYGYAHRTAGDSTLALIPLGYSDGIPRAASARGPVSINGRTYPVAGRIAMDQFVVDLGSDVAAVGDRAILFGDPEVGLPSAEDWARAAGTINYEIVARLGPRIERTYSS
jgi:alanine racemase